jgi:hypothetical protein
VRLDDFVEVPGMRVFFRLARLEGNQGGGILKPPDYEWRFIEPDRPFSMDLSGLPNHGHEPAMWKQDLYSTEQEGLRFILNRKSAGNGRCKIVVDLSANGFLTKSGVALGSDGRDELRRGWEPRREAIVGGMLRGR